MTEPAPDLPLRATRAAALRAYARTLGATGFLDQAFSRCPRCDARAIAERVSQEAAGARRVGTLVGPESRYEVFSRGTGPHPVRLLVERAADGSREILAADRRPPASQPPSYLGELELLELEEEIKAMRARLLWEPKAVDADVIDTKFSDRHHHLYIPVSAGGTPLKVGETTRLMKDRYSSDWISTGEGGYAKKYWVARVLVEDTRRGHSGQWIPAQKHQVQDVESLVARRLSRGGAILRLHDARKSGPKVLPLTALGIVKVGSPLPTSLHIRYPDKPTESGVAAPRLRNNIDLAPGACYEVRLTDS
jgi:hypothetical protein